MVEDGQVIVVVVLLQKASHSCLCWVCTAVSSEPRHDWIGLDWSSCPMFCTIVDCNMWLQQLVEQRAGVAAGLRRLVGGAKVPKWLKMGK